MKYLATLRIPNLAAQNILDDMISEDSCVSHTGSCADGGILYPQSALLSGVCPAQIQISGVLNTCLAAGTGFCCCRGKLDTS